jgi:hypothetical protein
MEADVFDQALYGKPLEMLFGWKGGAGYRRCSLETFKSHALESNIKHTI